MSARRPSRGGKARISRHAPFDSTKRTARGDSDLERPMHVNARRRGDRGSAPPRRPRTRRAGGGCARTNSSPLLVAAAGEDLSGAVVFPPLSSRLDCTLKTIRAGRGTQCSGPSDGTERATVQWTGGRRVVPARETRDDDVTGEWPLHFRRARGRDGGDRRERAPSDGPGPPLAPCTGDGDAHERDARAPGPHDEPGTR
jgi:hypothetical protein